MRRGTNEVELNIKPMLIVTDEDIDDIMCAAIEGGISYWCDECEIEGTEFLGEYTYEQISRGGNIRLHVLEEDDEDDGCWYTLTKEKFLKGIKECFEYDYAECQDALSGGLPFLEMDTGQIDSEIADCIIQLSIFGDLVFG